MFLLEEKKEKVHVHSLPSNCASAWWFLPPEDEGDIQEPHGG